MKIEVAKLSEWKLALADFCKGLKGNEILLLKGPLGAGKTTFVHALVQNLFGEQGPVASPTFALHHQYRQGKQVIDHWDLYRTESLDELDAAGFWELLNAGSNLCVIEWPEKIPARDWPAGRRRIMIQISVGKSGVRVLEIGS